MRKEKMNQKLSKLTMGMLTLVLALALGLFANVFAIVSHAESTAKVTASSAKIRKEASTSSEVLGSVAKDTKISIISQVNGSDGYVWYQTYANATTTGYVRSDLVKITDGSTPDTGASETAGGISDAGVTKINPISATVTGGSSVRIRSQASTSGKIVTTASNGLALTVNGTIDGSDGKTWYLVSYSANGSEVSGYIRSDFVSLSGEITPLTETPVETTETPIETTETPEETTPVVLDDYDVAEENGVWYLTLPKEGLKYDIQELFNKVDNNAEAYTKAAKKAKNEKVIIIVLVIILLGAIAAIAYLLMKMKEMSDNAYYRQVENETLRRRGAQQGQKQVQQKQAAQKQAQPAQGQKAGEPKKVMQTVGEDKPQGARPAQAQGQAQRPAGQGTRPAQAQGQAQRPAGQGTRPAQAQGQAQRPAGQGTRPAQAQGQAQRPAGQASRPAGAQPTQQAARPVGTRPAQPAQQASRPVQTQPKKTILADDDEFEFDFLNELDKE